MRSRDDQRWASSELLREFKATCQVQALDLEGTPCLDCGGGGVGRTLGSELSLEAPAGFVEG